MKRSLRGAILSGVVHAKEASRHLQEFGDSGMTREFVEAVWVCYKANGTNLTETPLLAKQRAVVRNLHTARPSDVPEKVDDDEDDWDFKGVMIAEKVARLGIRGKL